MHRIGIAKNENGFVFDLAFLSNTFNKIFNIKIYKIILCYERISIQAH